MSALVQGVQAGRRPDAARTGAERRMPELELGRHCFLRYNIQGLYRPMLASTSRKFWKLRRLFCYIANCNITMPLSALFILYRLRLRKERTSCSPKLIAMNS